MSSPPSGRSIVKMQSFAKHFLIDSSMAYERSPCCLRIRAEWARNFCRGNSLRRERPRAPLSSRIESFCGNLDFEKLIQLQDGDDSEYAESVIEEKQNESKGGFNMEEVSVAKDDTSYPYIGYCLYQSLHELFQKMFIEEELFHILIYTATKIMRLRVCDGLKIGFKPIGNSNNIPKMRIFEDYINMSLECNLAFRKSIPNSASYWFARATANLQ
ncbi:hypothetical protein EVAR_7183_1 [Eumeta japonica]|uniref:Uncharacterized protein n=1 Tax=Eumeta variegata TaxID=151549 RepID=A0A4C1U7Y5_EUMVA|nr:hypothetical protein EVAR_7183_1 [Eumeta japonica]